ncbi:MAG: hypothetical protein AB7F76_18400 [Parvibaculaceae bacterium]
MKRAIFATLFLLTGTAAVEAAACNDALYRDILGRLQTLQRESGSCRKAMTANDGVAKMCKTCRQTFTRMAALDSILRKNYACFQGKQRVEIHKVLIVQDTMLAVSKRCGQ